MLEAVAEPPDSEDPGPSDGAASAPDALAPDDELDALNPVEPAEPVVSAIATAGIHAIAEPTPTANTSAPKGPR